MSSAQYSTHGEHSAAIIHGPWILSEAGSTWHERSRQATGPARRRRGRLREQDPILQSDRAAMAIARALGEIDPWLARSAAEYKAQKSWWRHGFARMEDHCREVFHRSGRWLRDLAVLGRAFKQEERLQAAFTGSDGGAPLGRCRAVLIAHVATSLTLSEWIALARRCSVQELRRHVRQVRSQGTGPPESPPQKRLVDDEEPDTDERCRLTFQVPFPIVVAFDEGLELYRAVQGHEASVTGFVKALMGEQAAEGEADETAAPGALPGVERSPRAGERTAPRAGAPDVGVSDVGAPNAGASDVAASDVGSSDAASGSVGSDAAASGAGVSDVAASASVGSNPNVVPDLGDEPSALERSDRTLARFEAVRQSLAKGERPDPADQIEALVSLEEDLERRLGEVLLSIADSRGWRRLGYTGAGHYAEQRLGVSRSWAEDRVRAARSLRRFPRLRESYEKGDIGMEAVLRVSAILKRAPDPEVVIDAWVNRASECTIKRLRDESRALARRSAGLFVERHRERDAESHAPLDDPSWFRSLARDAGTARRRIRVLAELALCRPVADTPLVLRLPEDVADDFLLALRAAQPRAAAACRIFSKGEGEQQPQEQPAAMTADGPPAACRIFSTGGPEQQPREQPAAMTSDGPLAPRRIFSTGGPEQQSPAPASEPAFDPASASVPAWAALLALIEDFVQEWDRDDDAPRRRNVNEEAFIAFGWRCSAPGCTSRRMLQVHHVVYRSQGGGDEKENLLVLCLYHHLRGEHGDLAACRGRSPLGITWRLGPRATGRYFRNERHLNRPTPCVT